MKRTGHFRFSSAIRRGAALVAVGLGVAACSPTIDQHGNILDPQIVQSIRTGQTTRQQVSSMLGTPSAMATFDKEAWYYVGERKSRLAFLEPEVLERKVLVIRFDKNGVVQQVEKLGKDDGRDVDLVERKTPTRGRELTIVEQLIGNVGRFGGGQIPDDGPGSGPTR